MYSNILTGPSETVFSRLRYGLFIPGVAVQYLMNLVFSKVTETKFMARASLDEVQTF